MTVLRNNQLHSYKEIRQAWDKGKVFLFGDKPVTKHDIQKGETVKLVGKTNYSKEVLSRTGKVKPRLFFDPPHDISITITA